MTSKTEDDPGRRRFAPWLAAIAAVGLVGRVAYLLAMRDRALTSDGLSYVLLGRGLAGGEGFVNPLAAQFGMGVVQDATHPPLWTTVLAAVIKLGGDEPLALQFTATLVGVGTIVVTGLAAREAFGRRVGLIAAALVAVYPGIWLYERELASESLGLLGVATIIWLTYRFWHRPGPWLAIALGVVVALCALTRSELIIMSLLIVTPMILARRDFSWGRRAGWLAMAGAATIAVISPWFLYNTTRFAEPVPLSVGVGRTMQAGNCKQTYTGARIGYYDSGCVFRDLGFSDDPSVADAEAREFVLEYIRDNKASFVKVAMIRVGRTFSVYAPMQQIEFEAERGTSTTVLSAAFWSFWLLVPLAAYGAIVARRRKVPVYPLLTFFVLAVIVVVPTVGAVRYRAMSEVSLVILAAVGVDAIVRAFARRRSGAVAVPADASDRPQLEVAPVA